MNGRISEAHDYARRAGYLDGFPNFHGAVYNGVEVWGTFLVPAVSGAEFRDVPLSELGNVAISDVPSMMRAAQVYAVNNGFVAAMPTFHQATYNGVEVRGIYLFRSNAVEFRDVPSCQLGFAGLLDVGRLFRAVNDYSGRAGFAGGFPTFYNRKLTDGNTVYGVILFKSGMLDWRDVKTGEYNQGCGGVAQSRCSDGCDFDAPYYWDGLCRKVPPPPPPPPPCGSYTQQCCTTNSPCRTDAYLTCIDNRCEYTPPGSGSSSGTGSVGMSSTGCGNYANGDVVNPVISSNWALITKIKNTSGYEARVRHTDKNGKAAEVLLSAGAEVDWSTANLTYAGVWSTTISTTCAAAPSSVAISVQYRMP
ncbi:hypothetical protein P2318_09815 [Myxococcaceae bacterium GXIMD 01537]